MVNEETYIKFGDNFKLTAKVDEDRNVQTLILKFKEYFEYAIYQSPDPRKGTF